MDSKLNFGLNDRAAAIVDSVCQNPAVLGVEVHRVHEATVVDCGVKVRGGLAAGIAVARACLADCGEVAIQPGHVGSKSCPVVSVRVDRPWIGCLLSQYAGWAIAREKFFAMGSGPMRVVRGNEKSLEEFGYSERSQRVVGILETSKLPGELEVRWLSESLSVEPSQLLLLVARTASMAGSLQVVARSLETCMHKLHEVGFPVTDVVSGSGSAFMPPIPKDDLTAIGRTNDSILYGGEVLLWVDVDDSAIDELGPKVPASASADYGEPFAKIFERYGGDFYKIDPMLFSPATVTFNNLRTGRTSTFGKVAHDLVERSFFG